MLIGYAIDMNDILQIILSDLLVVCTGVVLICFIIIYRINQVYKYRIQLLGQISLQAKVDIQYRRDWQWRYTVFESASFDDMVYRFWRPLPDFYPNKRFIEEA